MNTQPDDFQRTSDNPENIATPDEMTAGRIFIAILREIAETIIFALILLFVLQLLIRNFRVEGHSMDPNLHNGQYLVVDKLSYHLPFEWRSPQRGDVVVFVPPSQPGKDFVKRIIGLPGDTVEIQNGDVRINGEPLSNVFEAKLDKSSMAAQTVPDGYLFVLGDNRPNSNDSRNWGMLLADDVVGKAWLSYWPPETWGTIPPDRPTADATWIHWLKKYIK